jgi:hypothetical protein
MSQQDRTRYAAAMHAMQTGVALKMNYDQKETSPKSLRVGVNSALVSNGALAKLLIDKGLITLDELESELADMAERDATSYQDEANAHFGGDGRINLG